MSAESRLLAGRYRIDELIGQGGMSRVYRGHDVTLGRDVAIKVLAGSLAADPAFRARFRMEAQAASRMSHPSIVRVFDAGDPQAGGGQAGGDAEPPFIVMELVEGRLLRDIMDDGPVPVEDALRYVDGILEALEYSHQAGVVHRDIKPGNVMVTTTGRVKVMDFGIARAVTDSQATIAETTRIIGTAAYLSPEQAKGETADARTDLYSVGIVLYELITGQQPFRGDSPVAVAYQHVSEAPPLPTEVNSTAPAILNPIIFRALAKDPNQRYASAASFRAALAASTTARPPSRRRVNALSDELYGTNTRHTEETVRSLQQLSTDTTMTRTQSGPPTVWIWGGVVLVAVLLASVVFWLMNMRPDDDLATGARTVPVLAGMTQERAEQALRDQDLMPVVRYESSATVIEGVVIRSTPGEGATVRRGEDVLIWVSTGVVTTTVPELIGLSDIEARAAIEEADLDLGSINRQNQPATPAGTVLSASHEAGAEVAPGTVINLIVASGRVTLVDLTGFVLDTAIAQLDDIELEHDTVGVDSCPATSPATVWGMSEPPGDVAITTTVILTYCTGS